MHEVIFVAFHGLYARIYIGRFCVIYPGSPHLVRELLQNAVNEISKELKSGEIALLSPAAASLDQFKSYAERGDKFKEFIKAL